MKLRLLLVTPYFSPHRGGIERVAEEQARRLSRDGADVTVVTTASGAGHASREDRDGHTVLRVRSWNPFERLGVPWPLPSPTLPRLEQRPDVVLAHGHPYLTSLLASRIARRHGAALVLHQHNTFIEYGWPLDSIQRVNDRLLGRRNLRAADEIVCASEATARYVKLISGRHSRILYNGVDAEFFRPVVDSALRASVRAAWGLDATRPLFVSQRRLQKKNGLHMLLEAARALPEVRFAIIGDGPERARLAAVAPANVHLFGFLPADALREILACADGFVLPSRPGEGFPLAVLEAMASGLPVAATRSGGHTEILDDACGALVPPGDVSALVRVLAEWSRDPDARARRGREARRRIEAALTWDHHMRGLRSVLHSVLNGAKPMHAAPVPFPRLEAAAGGRDDA